MVKGCAHTRSHTNVRAWQAAPVIGILARVLNALGPVFDFISLYALKFWAFIQPYHPEELAPMFFVSDCVCVARPLRLRR